MRFNLNIINQAGSSIAEKHKEMIFAVGKLGQQSEWTRLLAGPTFLASSLLSVVETITILAEMTFKGLSNIIGSPFSSHCSISRGLRQICHLPVIMIFQPVSILAAAKLGLQILFTPKDVQNCWTFRIVPSFSPSFSLISGQRVTVD